MDASKHAYGAVAYFCYGDKTSFVASRARVAPIKAIECSTTLPQLELLAAYVGAHLANSIMTSIEKINVIPTITLWSDSQIVLYWLAKKGSFPNQTVANRTEQIRTITAPYKTVWRYCPTEDNPADLLTRGISFTQFQAFYLWVPGPPWLIEPNKWPSGDGNHLLIAYAVTTPDISRKPPSEIFAIVDVKRYRWDTLIRVIAVV